MKNELRDSQILRAALNIVFDQNAFEDGRQRVIIPQATGSWMVATQKDGKLGVTGFYKTAFAAFTAIKEQMKASFQELYTEPADNIAEEENENG